MKRTYGFPQNRYFDNKIIIIISIINTRQSSTIIYLLINCSFNNFFNAELVSYVYTI
jgi:hypothetical protein